MVERGDLLALHEPLEGLMYFGATEVEGRTFESATSLLAWLLDQAHDISVFLKETTDRRVLEVVLADRRFLAEARHAFLIRRPEEIAASGYAVIATVKEQDSLYPDLRLESIGLEALHELYAAVRVAGGHRPVVVDSDDLVARPEATMAAYCAAVELPFIPEALTWEPGERRRLRNAIGGGTPRQNCLISPEALCIGDRPDSRRSQRAIVRASAHLPGIGDGR